MQNNLFTAIQELNGKYDILDNEGYSLGHLFNANEIEKAIEGNQYLIVDITGNEILITLN
jgi:hypothetical protein